jgi:uncharacterized membrane protein
VAPEEADPTAEARRRRILALDTRWRVLFAVAAVVLPLALYLVWGDRLFVALMAAWIALATSKGV